MNDEGEATVADIVAACDWILQNKAQYNIRVANFSLHAMDRASLFFDPLDQAVEKLWLNGVVVVTAAGNYATDGQESGVPFAPGNDPFVITVGASDINDTVDTSDDTVAPWSAWGYTPDGFMKPDLSAPGRYIIGPVSAGAGLAIERPDHVTSDAERLHAAQRHVVLGADGGGSGRDAAGAASRLDARPGQGRADGLGQRDAWRRRPARSASASSTSRARGRSTTPPNPNAGLDQFLTTAASTAPSPSTARPGRPPRTSDAAWGDAAW